MYVESDKKKLTAISDLVKLLSEQQQHTKTLKTFTSLSQF